MTQSTRWTRRSLTWALALALALIPSATCLMGAQMTEADKTCCSAMNHDCGDKAGKDKAGTGVEQNCCVADSLSLQGLTSGLLVAPLAPPALVLVSTFAAQPEPAPSFVARAAFTASDPPWSSRPTYLVVSVFRL